VAGTERLPDRRRRLTHPAYRLARLRTGHRQSPLDPPARAPAPRRPVAAGDRQAHPSRWHLAAL